VSHFFKLSAGKNPKRQKPLPRTEFLPAARFRVARSEAPICEGRVAVSPEGEHMTKEEVLRTHTEVFNAALKNQNYAALEEL